MDANSSSIYNIYNSPIGASYRSARDEALMRQMAEYAQWRDKRFAPVEMKQPWGGMTEEEEDSKVATKLANTWLVGCDPEFVIINAAGKIFNVEGSLPHNGPVGYDHSGNVVEIRPEPALGTFALLKRMQKLLTKDAGLQALVKHKWRAGAVVKAGLTRANDGMANARGERVLTLGGHVHFDFPPPREGSDPAVFEQRIKALDKVTEYLERLDILPQVESAARRGDAGARANGYGKWGDWRPAAQHVEYRTMASWLYDPRVAFLAITAAKLAAVSPMVAMESLKPRTASYNGLIAFFDFFRHRDTNARRALDKLLESVPLRALQTDPDGDFKDRWKNLGV